MWLRRDPLPEYEISTALLKGLANIGRPLAPDARILDYGCGAGGLVYGLRERGFEAHGFDLHKPHDLKDDLGVLRFADPSRVTRFDMSAPPDAIDTGFEPESFDCVVSTSVLEHVLDHAPVMSEIARVLKPDGFALHVYPGRTSLIEPHMYVPLATRIQSWHWFHFWAALGVRNEFQGAMTARERATANWTYSRIGINYPPKRQMIAICRRHFRTVEIVDADFYRDERLHSRPMAALRNMKHAHPLKALSQAQRLTALLTANPRR